MKRITLCMLALFVLVAGCKKSEKGETKRWNRAMQTVNELVVRYPGFKSALEEQRAKAKAAMDTAKAASDKEQRIKKMSAANDMLTAGFVGQLSGVDSKKKAIQSKMVEVKGQAGDKADRASAQQAAENAKQTLAQVDATLKQGAKDANTARIVLKQVTRDLEAADKTLAKAASIAQGKKQATQAKKNAASTPGTAGGAGAAKAPAAKPDPKAEQWTCEFCDHVNSGEHDTCQNCGAPRPAKK